MQIPNEGDQKKSQEIQIPGDLRSVYSDSAMLISKGDIVSILFLEPILGDGTKKKGVAQVYMTPRDLRAFVDKANEVLEKSKS